MNSNLHYAVLVQIMACDCERDVMRLQRFEDENTAQAYAVKLANVFGENDILYDIDVFDIDHCKYLTNHSNLTK
jgi:hypothetical protein